MSLELPGYVVDAFYFIGLPWPGVDEDELRGWARDLREFIQEITTISGMSKDAVAQTAQSGQSAFMQTMAQHWEHHHTQIMAMREPMNIFADALDASADVVIAQKEVVIGAAVALAAEVLATQGEALVTFGLAEAEVPLEVEATKMVIRFALQELEAKLLGILINQAAQEVSDHLNRTVRDMLSGGGEVAFEAYALKADTTGLRNLASTLKTHAGHTENVSTEAYRRSTNRKIETDSKGGRWPVAAVLEQALLSIARDIFRSLPGTLHQVTEGSAKDVEEAARKIEQIEAREAEEAGGAAAGTAGAGAVLGGGPGWDKVDEEQLFKRSGFRKKSVQSSWDDAEDGPDGTKLCPTCRNPVTVPPFSGTKRDWDVDHQPSWADRVDRWKTGPTPPDRKQVLDNYNSGLRLECPHCNRSRGRNSAE